MRALLISLMLLAVTLTANGEDDGDGRSARVDESISSIQRELEQIDTHPWAGVYRTGPGLSGTTLFVAPNSGAAYRVWTCVGTIAENSGVVKEQGTNLEIVWTFASESPDPIETVYIPIKWGQSHFLVRRSEVLEFCQQARSKRPHLSQFLRRDGGEEPVPNGDPELPPEYVRYATMEDILGRVVSVKQQAVSADPDVPRLKVISQDVTLDVGANDGIQPKMRLYMTEPHSNSPICLTVNIVHENHCKASGWVWALDEEQITSLEKNIEYSTSFWKTISVQLGRTKP